MSNPCTHDEAVRLAVWVGECFTHLNETQVREFRLMFETSGADAALIEHAVRVYAAEHPYATISGIADAISIQRKRDAIARQSAADRLAAEAEIAAEIDRRINAMTPGEIAEMRRVAYAPLPESIRARLVRANGAPIDSGLIRGVVRSIIEHERGNRHEQPDARARTTGAARAAANPVAPVQPRPPGNAGAATRPRPPRA